MSLARHKVVRLLIYKDLLHRAGLQNFLSLRWLNQVAQDVANYAGCALRSSDRLLNMLLLLGLGDRLLMREVVV